MIINLSVFIISLVFTSLYLHKVRPIWFLKLINSTEIDNLMLVLTSITLSLGITILFLLTSKYVSKLQFEKFKKYHYIPPSISKIET